MRFVLLALLVVVSCKKSEPAKSADPTPAPAAPAGSAATAEPPAAAPAPDPAPPPPPPAKTPNEAAVEASIAIFKAVAPITEKYREAGDDCVKKGLPEVEKVLEGMKAQTAVIQEVTKDPENAKVFFTALFKGDESALSEAKSAALGPALHCPKVHDRILEALGVKLSAPAKKKK